MQPLPRGNRVAIITNAGGPGVIAADVIEQSGMKVATLHKETASTLRDQLPSAAIVNNPIDVLGDADPARYATAVKAAQQDDSVDAIIVILTPHAMVKPVETAQAVCERSHNTKPVLAVFLGSSQAMYEVGRSAGCNLPSYPSPERAVAALRAMHEYAVWRDNTFSGKSAAGGSNNSATLEDSTESYRGSGNERDSAGLRF